MLSAGHGPEKEPEQAARSARLPRQHSSGRGDDRPAATKRHKATEEAAASPPQPTLGEQEMHQCPCCSQNGACTRVIQHMEDLLARDTAEWTRDMKQWTAKAMDTVPTACAALAGDAAFLFINGHDAAWRTDNKHAPSWDLHVDELPDTTLVDALPLGLLTFYVIWWHSVHGNFCMKPVAVTLIPNPPPF